MADERHVFGDNRLSAVVSAQGAELQDVTAHEEGAARPLLWDGGAAWPRRSPILFPIVGRLPERAIDLDGAPVRLGQHGFARDMRFDWIARDRHGCVLELRDDDRTRAAFPRRFSLTLSYRIQDGALRCDYSLRNPDAEAVLPASLGAHPAFLWPQGAGVPRDAHRLVFAQDETAPLHRIAGGLLAARALPTPIRGRELHLTDSLFSDDALIFLDLRSRSVHFVTPEGRGIAVGWHGFPHLGIWTKPGAGFLCIEPWQGYAAPEDFAGDFARKPGLVHLAPGERFDAGWSVAPIGAAGGAANGAPGGV